MADSDRTIAGEVTRVESIEYLGGATGHCIASLGLLGVGALGTWATGRVEFGFGTLVAAWLVSVNGLSLFAWDRLRDYVEKRTAGPVNRGQSRTLTAHSLSRETKAELVAGFVQIGALVLVVLLTVETVRRLGAETGAYAIASGLAIGNVAALAVALRSKWTTG